MKSKPPSAIKFRFKNAEKELKPAFVKRLKKSCQDIKEGRAYTYWCSHTKEHGTVCYECHVKECKHWYKLGKKDCVKRS